ncbi:MAG: hypothetical protein OXI25_04090, partial [Chloroflexota bacterium]|nr:hypothetical protein [Chloroflexota bacterium]
MGPTPRRPLLRTALLLALCSVALTGCFRFELAIKVDEDGSGVANIVAAFEDSFLRLAGEELADFTVSPDPETLPPGVAVEEYRQAGFAGQRFSVAVPDMEQLPQALEELGDESAAFISDLELTREGEVWRFSLAAELPVSEQAAGTDFVFRGDSYSLEDLLETASYTVRLALPGEIADHNADRVEDDELVWDIDFTSKAPRRLSARSQPPDGL